MFVNYGSETLNLDKVTRIVEVANVSGSNYIGGCIIFEKDHRVIISAESLEELHEGAFPENIKSTWLVDSRTIHARTLSGAIKRFVDATNLKNYEACELKNDGKWYLEYVNEDGTSKNIYIERQKKGTAVSRFIPASRDCE